MISRGKHADCILVNKRPLLAATNIALPPWQEGCLWGACWVREWVFYSDECVLTVWGCYLWMNSCRERFPAILTLSASLNMRMGNIRVARKVLEEEPKGTSPGTIIKVCSTLWACAVCLTLPCILHKCCAFNPCNSLCVRDDVYVCMGFLDWWGNQHAEDGLLRAVLPLS